MMSPLTLLRITITLFPHVAEDWLCALYASDNFLFVGDVFRRLTVIVPLLSAWRLCITSPSAPMVMVFLGPLIATTIPSSELAEPYSRSIEPVGPVSVAVTSIKE